MDRIKRCKLGRAMEFVARQINDELVFEPWLVSGVADGGIEYGDLAVKPGDEVDLECYVSDEDFAELMGVFLRRMAGARKSGGLHCDGIVSSE